MRKATLIALLATSLVACVRDEPLKAIPTIVASRDLELAASPTIYLGAQANDADGEIASIDWLLVSAPDPTQTSLKPLGQRGEVLELSTGAVPGLYVLSVTATDDDGQTSEPDYVNLTLKPAGSIGSFELLCLDGCDEQAEGLYADEGSTVLVEARAEGVPLSGLTWSAALARDPDDSLTGEPTLAPGPAGEAITIPAVARPGLLTVTATLGSTSAQLVLNVRNSVDEAPRIHLTWSQPGGEPVSSEAAPAVLPGDALHVTAEVSDPNGDTVGCRIETSGPSAERSEGEDPCRITLYPLSGGSLRITAAATTAEPAAETRAEALSIQVKSFVLEAQPALAAVAVDEQGRILAAGAEQGYHLWTGGEHRSFGGTPAGGSAVAFASQERQSRAFVGWSGSGSWSQLDLVTGEPLSDLDFPTATEPPHRTWAMANGTDGRVVAATEEGLVLSDRLGSDLLQWLPPGGLDARAVAVGPSGSGAADGERVWFASGSTILTHPNERFETWEDHPGVVGRLTGEEISALALGPSELPDLWVGTAQPAAPQAASALHLFRDCIDPDTGNPRMAEDEPFFSELGTVAAIAVEQQGPYAGDAWVVVGDKLMRVSRAAVNDPAGQRGAMGLEIQVAPEAGAIRAVAVQRGADRTAALASDNGLIKLQ